MKELKAKYKEDFQRLQVLINEFDPCGLIESGSPIDEYDGLTEKILSLVYGGESKTEIRKAIITEIGSRFGSPTDLSPTQRSYLEKSLDNFLIRLDFERPG